MAHAHQHGGHAEQPLNRLAASATNHCLTGCVLGEVVGMTVRRGKGHAVMHDYHAH